MYYRSHTIAERERNGEVAHNFIRKLCHSSRVGHTEQKADTVTVEPS